MSNETEDVVFRRDEHSRKSMEIGLELFKYMASVAWAPVVIFTAFLQSGWGSTGLAAKVAVTIIVLQLVLAGSLFFVTYLRMSNGYSFLLASHELIDDAEALTPGTKQRIVANAWVTRRLSQLCDRLGFPMLTLGYVEIVLLVLYTMWFG